MSTKNFEIDLIKAIQPIRFFVLASAIFHLFETGVYDQINNNSTTIEELSSTLRLDLEKITGFLLYCVNENLVELDDSGVRLTEFGKSFSAYRGWYEMLIVGYGSTFLQIGTCLSKDSGSATRDAKYVGIGSCAISQYDALPLTKKLLSFSDNNYQLALDIGCGNAQYLVEFCRYFPNINAIGVEPDNGGFLEAQTLVRASGFQDRIQLFNKTAIDFFSNTEIEPDLVIISFVLHEILGQSGEHEVKNFLKSITQRFSNIDIVIIEVDNQISKPEVMRHGLSEAYYNPYYLLHYFTNQKLETDAYWTGLFEECGLRVLAKDYPDNCIDSTKLEIGYLLRSNNV